MARWPATRIGQWRARQAASDQREHERRVFLQRNPRFIVENITSRQSVCVQVAQRMVNQPGDMPAAIAFVAERIGVPPETVQECLTVEALESGQ